MRPAARPPLASLLRVFVSLSVIATLGLPGLAVAQGVTGGLQGTVISPEGIPEPDVRITVVGPHLQGARSTTTDRDGIFQFLLLPPGTYEIRAGRVGSRPILVRNLVVVLGRMTAAPTLTLEPQAIQMDSVVVVAPPISLDPVHTTRGACSRPRTTRRSPWNEPTRRSSRSSPTRTKVDEWHYAGVDSNGNPILPSPNYLAPKAYQPPMAVRPGMEVGL